MPSQIHSAGAAWLARWVGRLYSVGLDVHMHTEPELEGFKGECVGA